MMTPQQKVASWLLSAAILVAGYFVGRSYVNEFFENRKFRADAESREKAQGELLPEISSAQADTRASENRVAGNREKIRQQEQRLRNENKSVDDFFNTPIPRELLDADAAWRVEHARDEDARDQATDGAKGSSGADKE